ARKSPNTAFDSSSRDTASPATEGPNAASLPADLRAAILALVKESTRITLSDIVGTRPSPTAAPTPVPGVAEADTRDDPEPEAAAELEAIPLAHISGDMEAPAEAPALPSTRLRRIDVGELEPAIFLAGRDERSELGKEP